MRVQRVRESQLKLSVRIFHGLEEFILSSQLNCEEGTYNDQSVDGNEK